MELTQQTVETAIYEGRSYMSKSGRKRWSQHVLWDDSLPGFGLRITSTNRKSFIVSYRAAGRKRTKSLGAAGRLKLDEARRRAADLLAAVAEEQPKAATRHPLAEGVVTVAQLADTYLEQCLKGNVPSWYADQRLMQVHIKPAMGRASIAEVTQTDLASLRRSVGRRFPADARRLAALLGSMFDWAAERGLWSKSSRGGDPAVDDPASSSRSAPEPAAEPAPPPTAAELRESLERSEADARDLAARLDEVAVSGADMLARLGEQSAAREELKSELARARRELDRARGATASPQAQEKADKQLATLRQSVEQLMASLREARDERREMAEKLAEVEAQDRARANKSAALTRRRNEREARLLEQERQIAVLKAKRPTGGGRLALGVLAGAVGGALLMFGVLRSLEPGEAVPRVTAGPPEAATPGGTGGAVADLGSAGGELPADPGPGTTAAAGLAGKAVEQTGDGAPADPLGGDYAPDFTAAESAVQSWAAAWSEQRVDDYLAAYSEQFAPPEGLGRGEWAFRRRNRLQRPAWIRVTVEDMRQTVLGAGRVRVDFEQSYETDSYSDVVRKSIELVWEDGGWRITAERSL